MFANGNFLYNKWHVLLKCFFFKRHFVWTYFPISWRQKLVVPTCDVIDFQVRGGFAISRVPQVITSRPLAATEVRDQEQAQGGLKIREAGDVAVDPQKSKDEIDTLLPTNQVRFSIGYDDGFSIFFDYLLIIML